MARFPNSFAPGGDMSEAINNLTTALFAGESPNKRAEREALVESRKQDAALKQARQDKIRADMDAARAAQEARASAPQNFLNEFIPGQGRAVADYRNAGGIQKAPFQADTFDETDTLPAGLQTTSPMARPAGYTPEVEAVVNRLLGGYALSQGLPGKTNFAQLTQGAGNLQKQGVVQNAAGGVDQPIEDIANAFYAVEGKPLYTEKEGRILSPAYGTLDESGDAAQAATKLLGAQTSLAGARAGTERIRQGLLTAQTAKATASTPKPPPAGQKTELGADGKPLKPLPAPALKMQQEALDAIGTASAINADLGALDQQIAEKKLNFGPVKNVVAGARNLAGMSNEQSRNFASFKATLEKLRNDSLRLNKGTQTEGDAVRAWNEIMANINDTALVQQRLKEVQQINERGSRLRQLDVDMVRGNYGYSPMDFSGYTKQKPAVGAKGAPSAAPAAAPARDTSVVEISSDEEWDALPAGARFIGPDGVERVK